MKHLNRLEQVLAQGEWEDPQIAEGLMLDWHGNLIEGTMSNVFVVLDGVLCTPLLTECGISGIMREVILEHCRSSGMPVTERTIPLGRIRDIEEMFLCNSLIGIWPVRILVMEEWQREFPAPRVAAVLRRQLQEREALPPDA
jgi:4-amino-4-deoxychorismate lyase